MRSMKKFGTAVAAASMLMAMIGAGSASAANFDPANTNLPAHGTLTLDAIPSGAQVHCTFTANIRSAGGDHASTVNAAGDPAGPTFDSCTATIPGLGNSAATVVATSGTAGAWTLTATSTTSVDVIGNATITAAGGLCTISAMNAGVANNAWNNTTHTLTTNTAATFPVVSGGFCTDTSARMTGSVTVPLGSIT
jgi:hypothetical protein